MPPGRGRVSAVDSLEDELLGEDGVLALPRVRLGHLDAVQVDVTVGAGEILGWQLVGLLHIQHQAAHLQHHHQQLTLVLTLDNREICRSKNNKL